MDTISAYKIANEYLITLGNDTETILIGTNDTIEGVYSFINSPIKLENNSIYFDDALEIKSMSAIASYLKDKKAYISTAENTLNIIKDENYNISGTFNLSLVDVQNKNDTIQLSNSSFTDVTPITIADPNIIETPKITKQDIEYILQTAYNLFTEAEQQQVLIDAFYTNQIEDRVFGELADFKNHTVSPKNTRSNNLWIDYYKNIYRKCTQSIW